MKGPQTPQTKSLRTLHKYLFGAFAFSIAVVGLEVLPLMVIRQTEIVTITEIGAARECRSRRSWKVFPKFRSEQPSFGHTYCGLIRSDYGSFELPESQVISLFGASREALFDSLTVGCRFEVTVAGPGLELRENGPASNRNRTLVSARPIEECLG